MKILFSALLAVVLVIGGNAQSKLIAEHVRNSEKIVEGAPFSAEAITESVQMFPDGNRITRRTTSKLYRDGEGRLRREDMPKQFGLPGAVVEVPESILIIDPVAGLRYVLNSKTSTAHQFQLKSSNRLKAMSEMWKARTAVRKEQIAKRQEQISKRGERGGRIASEDGKGAGEGSGQGSGQGSGKGSGQGSGEGSGKGSGQGSGEGSGKGSGQGVGPVKTSWKFDKPTEKSKEWKVDRTKEDNRAIEKKMSVEKEATYNEKTEPLGVRDFGGIAAEGTRITTSIPAGKIGNEREINIVYEKWYSAELQLIVAAKHIDPAFGEQTYKLTNVIRTEPSRSLFSPPANYSLIEEKGFRPLRKPPLPPRPGLKGVPAPSAPLAKPVEGSTKH